MTTAIATPPCVSIFVVEDNDDMRLVLMQLLRATGFEVFEANCMKNALRDFSSSGSSILLSDIGLPDGNGWALLRTLREAGASPYAIAMSGFGTSEDKDASREAGYRHHLVKPIDLDMLEQVLDEVRREIEGAK